VDPICSNSYLTGEIDPNLSAEDQYVALLLEINPTSGNASFDAWDPMGEERTIQVYTDIVDETDNDWRFLTIPADDCAQVKTTCFTFQSGIFYFGIPNANRSDFASIRIFNPLEGKLADR
jgi:hypothetical protein